MDDRSFDSVTRHAAGGISRRGSLLTLAMAGLTAVLAGPLTADAKKRRGARDEKKPCPPCKKRKQGKCKGRLPDGTACSGGTCQAGSCLAAAPASPPPPASPPVPPPPLTCTTPASCPAPSASQLCAQATCIGGICGIGPKPANSVCRPAVGGCDVADVCNGTALDCPADQFKPFNTPCTSDGNVCTRDVCNGAGVCTHLPEPSNTSCGTDQICCGGTCCIAGEFCGSGGTCCRGLQQPCARPSQCCSNNCSFGVCI